MPLEKILFYYSPLLIKFNSPSYLAELNTEANVYRHFFLCLEKLTRGDINPNSALSAWHSCINPFIRLILNLGLI